MSAATSPDEMLRDPAQESRARALGRELRCLVCQNQSIDDSDADLAKDLRRIVRERVAAGESDGQVKDYLVARYGDFVLLKPPVRAETLALWLGPAAVLLLGGGLLFAFYRGGRQGAAHGTAPAELSAQERARLDRLLAGDGAEGLPALAGAGGTTGGGRLADSERLVGSGRVAGDGRAAGSGRAVSGARPVAKGGRPR